jgi:hypothetical protein
MGHKLSGFQSGLPDWLASLMVSPLMLCSSQLSVSQIYVDSDGPGEVELEYGVWRAKNMGERLLWRHTKIQKHATKN